MLARLNRFTHLFLPVIILVVLALPLAAQTPISKNLSLSASRDALKRQSRN